MLTGIYFPDTEEVLVVNVRKRLPDELSVLLDSLKGFFGWLHQPANSQAMESFTNAMITGGTVKQFVLEFLESPDQEGYPWSMLDDPYVVRTVVGKVAEWLNGAGMRYASELAVANHLRSYQSPS